MDGLGIQRLLIVSTLFILAAIVCRGSDRELWVALNVVRDFGDDSYYAVLNGNLLRQTFLVRSVANNNRYLFIYNKKDQLATYNVIQ